jgi:hypothetical protein
VVRGGFWNNNQDNARAAYRNNNHPDNRNNNLGFRVVCSSHILSSLLRRGLALVCIPVRPLRALPPASLTRAVLPALAADHGLQPKAKGLKMAQARPVRTGCRLSTIRRAYTE